MNIEKSEIIEEADIDFLTVDDLEIDSQEDEEKGHYVNNKELYGYFCDWIPKVREAQAKELPRNEWPQMHPFIANAIVEICTRRAYHAWYINYTDNWKQDMIGDAIEICVRYVHNFNPEKSKNPFSYITTLCRNAFEQRLDKERRQVYYQSKLIAENNGFFAELDETLDQNEIDGVNTMESNPLMQNWRENVETFEHHAKKKREKSRKKKKESALTKFIEED